MWISVSCINHINLKINCLKLHKTKSERKGEIYPHKKLLRDPPPSSLHELVSQESLNINAYKL